MFPYVMYLLGVMAGLILARIFRPKNVGILGFYDSEPGEPPVMIAELNQSVEDIGKLKTVTMTVSHR